MVRSSSSSRRLLQPSFADVATISAEEHAWELLLKISGANAKRGSDKDSLVRQAHAELSALSLEGHRLLLACPATGKGLDQLEKKKAARKSEEAPKQASKEELELAKAKTDKRSVSKQAEDVESQKQNARTKAEEAAVLKEKRAQEEAARKREEELAQQRIDEELLLIKARYEARKKEQGKDALIKGPSRTVRESPKNIDCGPAQVKANVDSPSSAVKEDEQRKMCVDKAEPDEAAKAISKHEQHKEPPPVPSGVRGMFQRIMSVVSASVDGGECSTPPRDSRAPASQIASSSQIAPTASDEDPSSEVPVDACRREGDVPQNQEPPDEVAPATDEDPVVSKSSVRNINKRARQRRDQLRAQRQISTGSDPVLAAANTFESAALDHGAEAATAAADGDSLASPSKVRQPRPERKTAESLSAKRKKNLSNRGAREDRDLSSTTTPGDSIDCDEPERQSSIEKAHTTKAVDIEVESEPEFIQVLEGWEDLLKNASSQDEADWVVFELLRDSGRGKSLKKGR